MIETRSTWTDSGYDCDHCGGAIFKRVDRIAGRPKQICYQCRLCGCRWSPAGDVLRLGSAHRCHVAQQDRLAEKVEEPEQRSRSRLWLIIIFVALALVLRFGGFAALRMLLPLAFAALLLALLFHVGREQAWW